MLGWLRRLMVATFGRSEGTTEQVNLTLIASQKARARSENVLAEVRPHIDRAQRLIAQYQRDEAARAVVKARR